MDITSYFSKTYFWIDFVTCTIFFIHFLTDDEVAYILALDLNFIIQIKGQNDVTPASINGGVKQFYF